jgi:hypothetical protein
MLMGYLAAPQYGMKAEEVAMWGAVAGRRATIDQKRERGFVYRNSRPLTAYEGSDLQKGVDYGIKKLFGKFDRWWNNNWHQGNDTQRFEKDVLTVAIYFEGKRCGTIENEIERGGCEERVKAILFMFNAKWEREDEEEHNPFKGVPGWEISFKAPDATCSYQAKLGNAAEISTITTGWWIFNEGGNGVGHSTATPSDIESKFGNNFITAFLAQETMCQ